MFLVKSDLQRSVIMKNRVISIVCLIAMLVSMTTLGALSSASAELWIDKEPAKNVDYSFAVVGDIQTITYTDCNQGTRYVANLFEWLIENKSSRKIEYVFELGDTVETLTSYPPSYNPEVNNPREWQLASTSISMLNGIIPYSVVRGNHDDEGGYHKYICTDYYQSQMDGFYYDPGLPATAGNSMSNHYRKIEIGGHKYLMLSLDYNVNDNTKAWANQIISENPDYHVIVSIHAFLHNSGNIFNGMIGQANENNETVETFFSGEALWNDVLSQHENVFMVLCGHASVPAPKISTDTGVHGNEVLKILVNPQEEDTIAPNGMVLMINVKGGGAEIEFEYLSTSRTSKPYMQAENQYTIPTPGNALPIVSVAPSTEETPTTTRTVTEAETTTRAPRTTKEKITREVTAADEEQGSSSGVKCSASITSTLTAACIIGTSLSAFAMRKRQED